MARLHMMFRQTVKKSPRNQCGRIQCGRMQRILRWVGVYYVFLALLAIAIAVWLGHWENTLWFCYLAIICIGIGILTRNGDLLLAQANILFVPLLIWNIDFWGSILAGHPLLGFTDYFWHDPPVSRFVSLQHIYTLPVVVAALTQIRPRNFHAWKLSMLEMTFLFVLSRIFTSPQFNINCVYGPRVEINVSFYYPYPLAWFVVVFMMVFVGDRFFSGLRPLITRETSETELKPDNP